MLWIFRDYYCVSLGVASLKTTSGPWIIHQTKDFLQTLKCFPSCCLLRLEELHKQLVSLRPSFTQSIKIAAQQKKKKENLTATTLSAAVVCIRVNNIHFHSSYYLQIYLSVLHCLPFRKEIFCGKNHLFSLGLPNITKDILLSDGRSRIIVQFLQFLQCSS